MNKTVFKLLRIFSNLTQHELGEKLGVHQSMIARYENGTHRISNKTENKIKEIALSSGVYQKDINVLEKLFYGLATNTTSTK